VNLTAEQLERYSSNPVALIAEQFVLEVDEPYGVVMQPFQQELFEAIFAVKPDGLPRYRLLYDERRRGESKTEDIAAAALADLMTGPDLHRSFAVAGDEDQARLVVDAIVGFKVRSPILEDIEIDRLVVRNRVTLSELRILSSDARTNYGIKPRRIFFDELSLQRDERQWTVMWSAIAKKAHAQMVAVTMSGWDFTGLAWRIRELARESDAYFFASREGTEPAPWLSAAQMEEQRLTLHPADYARFWVCLGPSPRVRGSLARCTTTLSEARRLSAATSSGITPASSTSAWCMTPPPSLCATSRATWSCSTRWSRFAAQGLSRWSSRRSRRSSPT